MCDIGNTKTLYEIFSWSSNCYNYYPCNNNELDVENLTSDSCIKFIDNYFKKGEKGIAVNDIYSQMNEKNNRPLHTVSLYLIFVLFLKNGYDFSDRIREYIGCDKGYFSNERKDILRFLFLLCLYHDYGYGIEKRKNPNEIKKYLNINRVLNSMDQDLFISPYTLDVIRKYLKYRKNVDHGITGGLLLKKRLYDNLLNALKYRSKEDDVNDFVLDGVRWSKCFDPKLYDYISSIIMKHNIYYAIDDGAKKKYRRKRLEKLIINRSEQRLDFTDNPILFLFCVLDTIEPTKRFVTIDKSSRDVKNILKSFSFTFISQTSFKINIKTSIGCEIALDRYICGLKELRTWININIDEQRITDKFVLLTFSWGD